MEALESPAAEKERVSRQLKIKKPALLSRLLKVAGVTRLELATSGVTGLLMGL